jgi:two-component system nitrogen regulation response regulator NtrX
MDKMKEKILVVDDDARIRDLLTDILAEQGFEVVAAADGAQALAHADDEGLSLVLLDYNLPDTDGIAVLQEMKRRKPALPVIMISAFGTGKLGAEAAKLGAYDFLDKPLEAERVLVSVRNALERDALRRKVEMLQAETFAQYRMIGNSAAMQQVYELIDRVAPKNASVLILGESGTGKELAARAIHQRSHRAEKPFVRINCAAIPPELIESELFGHVRGSFSGAVADKPGQLEVADQGTALLDEIGDMALPVQAKLLRFLQEGELQRVGSTRMTKVDVRVIAATNKNLPLEIKERRFRGDLYYRLNVVTLNIPPLRERKEDIPLLAEHFLAKFCRDEATVQKTLAPDAMNLLANQPWVGNVRELANVIQRCVVLLSQPVLAARDIEPLLMTGAGAVEGSERTRSLHDAREDFERSYILGVLTDCQWNVAEAARVLGVDRTSLYGTFKRLGIEIPKV